MYSFTKRIVDIIVASTGLVVFGPGLLIIAILLWAKMGRPILFKQVRAGYRGKAFTLVKFRTMRDERDAQGRLLPDCERLSEVGLILRQWSLDEVPQLWNVLIGDMSLVGPRPLLIDYLSRYSPTQARRHEVKPGLTGWAQIRGRNTVSWEKKFELDVWYVDHRTLALDMKILFESVATVFQRDGVSSEGHVTMPEFLGSDQGTP